MDTKKFFVVLTFALFSLNHSWPAPHHQYQSINNTLKAHSNSITNFYFQGFSLNWLLLGFFICLKMPRNW